MSLVQPDQFQPSGNVETTQEILSVDMTQEWIKTTHAGLLTEKDKDLLIQYESETNPEARIGLLQSTQMPRIATLILTFHDVVVVQYGLAIIDQALSTQPEIASYFSDSAPFLALLKRQECVEDSYTCWKTCRILAHLFCFVLDEEKNETEIRSFLSILIKHVLPSHAEPALYALQQLLRKSALRTGFIQANGIDSLKNFLDSPNNSVQSNYQTIFLIWILSFDKDLISKFTEIIPTICLIARQTQKEKVIRISLAALRNLAVNGHSLEKMVQSKLHKQLEIWGSKRWGDEDIVADIEFLTQKTKETIDEMSSFERYRTEILSGELEWTPVHFSETFWRENIGRFSENNFELIRVLSQLLSNPESKPTTKAIACYDIGEFVRLHPAGRKVVNDLGAKTLIMTILYDNNNDTEVQKQALLCTRKMMISNWEMVSVK
eukprot:c7401_g1_i1.p1 GENE.c7401_g1_i1~~c7401_g1_i1.p1  ORF type:complete len:453 (+),score=147.64 c7401_g1_i1:56-1360(+)